MNQRFRETFLPILAITIIAALAMSVSLWLLYRTAQNERMRDLARTSDTLAQIIESVAQFDLRFSKHTHPEGSWGATMSQVRDGLARSNFQPGDEELLIGRRVGDRVEILRKTARGVEPVANILFGSMLAEPMHLALQGRSGSGVLLDYDGVPVMAGYAPVPALGIGIVLKTPLSEVRAPYLSAAGWATGVYLLMVALFSAGFARFTRRLEARAESLTNAVIDHANALVVVLDREGRILRFNKSCEAISGYRLAEVEGKYPWDTVLPPEDADTVRKYAFEALANNPQAMTGRYTNYWVSKSGQRYLLEWLNNVLLDASGKLEFVVAIGIDVTEQRRTEEQMQRSAAQLRQTQEIAKVGSWELDHTTNSLAWSDETYRIFEIVPYTVSNLYQAFHDVVHPDDRAALERAYEQAVQNRTQYEISHRIVTPSGSIKWIHERGETTYGEDGRPIRTIGAAQDITERRRDEEALRSTSQIVSAVLDTTPVLIAYLDPGMNFIRVNQAYAAADGKVPDYFVGKNHFALYPNTENEAIFRRVAETGVAHTARAKPFEYEQHPERGVSHWDWTLTPIKDAAGKVTGLVLSLLNVTDQIKALEAVQRSEQALKHVNETLESRVQERTAALADALQLNEQLLATSPIGISAYNEGGECVFANEAMARLINATTAQVLAQNFRNIPSWQKFGLLPLALRVLHTGKTAQGEFRVMTSFGREAWFHTTFVRFLRSGEPHLLLLLRDITARKQAEDALATELHRNELILATTLDGFFAADREGRIRFANPAFCSLLGYSLDELLRMTIPNFEANESPADVAAHIAKVVALGHDRFDTRHRRKDGCLVDVEVSVNLVEIGGEKLFYAFARDITARKQSEAALTEARDAAERANAAKSEFLSRMSHELRTPMNAILGFAQLLEMEKLEAVSGDYTKEILRAGYHLLELINELLDLSRIEAGRLNMAIEPVDVIAILNEALHMIQPLADERGLRLRNHTLHCSAIHALADRTRLRQILVNLLSNATKYNKPQGSIGIACTERGDGVVRLSITDTGIGIPPAKRTSLFQPFERLGAEQTDVEGTGIGLALSRRLAELMGAKLGVDSTEGEGSTFWIDLIRVQADTGQTAAAAAGEARETALPGDTGLTRLLYIEDNPANLRLVEQVVHKQPGLNLITATTGKDGLAAARAARPALILLDIHLPDISGYEVLARLRTQPETQDIPVLALSAQAMPHDIEQGLAAGFLAYLTKPIKVQDLVSAINTALNRDAQNG